MDKCTRYGIWVRHRVLVYMFNPEGQKVSKDFDPYITLELKVERLYTILFTLFYLIFIPILNL